MIFKGFLCLTLAVFILNQVEHYFYIVQYTIFILIVISFIKSTNKSTFLVKILFIVLFWSLFFKIIPLFFIIDEDNLILYFTSVSFLSHYIEELGITTDYSNNVSGDEIKEIINDLIEKIESLNLSKKSILNQGEPNGPNDPDPQLILGLLDEKNKDPQEGNTVEDIFELRWESSEPT